MNMYFFSYQVYNSNGANESCGHSTTQADNGQQALDNAMEHIKSTCNCPSNRVHLLSLNSL